MFGPLLIARLGRRPNHCVTDPFLELGRILWDVAPDSKAHQQVLIFLDEIVHWMNRDDYIEFMR
jgi:hypothetical protein